MPFCLSLAEAQSSDYTSPAILLSVSSSLTCPDSCIVIWLASLYSLSVVKILNRFEASTTRALYLFNIAYLMHMYSIEL